MVTSNVLIFFMFVFSYLRRSSGGEDGIRTHETLLGPTPLAGERLRPLGHLSADPCKGGLWASQQHALPKGVSPARVDIRRPFGIGTGPWNAREIHLHRRQRRGTIGSLSRCGSPAVSKGFGSAAGLGRKRFASASMDGSVIWRTEGLLPASRARAWRWTKCWVSAGRAHGWRGSSMWMSDLLLPIRPPWASRCAASAPSG